jgi:protein phosphatase
LHKNRLIPVGDPPSPRAAHAATAVGTMIVVQGGIGPAGLSTEDLHVLDLTQAKPRWHRVVVQGPGPGPRYGHVMALVGQRFLVCTSGNDGKRPLADVWALDTAAKPYEWRKLDPEGDGPPPCIYATASARSDGLLLLSGGRDANSVPLDTAYGLAKHRDGRWEWAIAPGISPSSRYQHAAVSLHRKHFCKHFTSMSSSTS